MNNGSEARSRHMEMECRIKHQWVLKFLNEHKVEILCTTDAKIKLIKYVSTIRKEKKLERESQIPLPRFLQVDESQARTMTSVHQLKPHF